MRHLLSDVLFAFRLLRRAPTFALTLLGVLVAGIGATTAVFSIVNELLLRPLPFPEPAQLTTIWKTYEPVAREWPSSVPDLRDLQEKSTTFSSLAAGTFDAFSLNADDKPAEFVSGADVSAGFFETLGVRPQRGRFLGADDDRVEAARVCVVSADLWHRRFASDPALVGRAVKLNGELFTVVGIGPEGFRFGGPRNDRIDVWIPLAKGDDYAQRVNSRGWNTLFLLGRRKPGVTIERAQADLNGVTADLEKLYPDNWAGRGFYAVDLHDSLVGHAKKSLFILFAAVILVFLIVCANVASLLLARGATRRGEMAARAALGATRGRLVAQLVTEAVVVFVLGGAGGAVLASWLVDFFAEAVSSQVWSANVTLSVDAAAVTFAILVALVAGILFSLAPALATSRVEPQMVLKETATQAGVSPRQRFVRSALVVAQVAMACALLAASGLALRGFKKTTDTPPGFDPTNMIVSRISLPDTKYSDDDRAVALHEKLLARFAAEPGFTDVTANSAMPMSGSNSNGWFKIEGRPRWPRGTGPILERNVVTPGYFAAMGIPLLRGREFTRGDTKDGRKVLVISQATAEKFFPGEDPIGRRIDLQDHRGDDDEWREIVGVVGDVRKSGLSAPVSWEAYVPLEQHPYRFMTMAARSPDPVAALRRMREIVNETDPDLALFGRQLMTDKIADWYGEQRFLTMLLGVFALAALVLSTLGLFGLVSYTTSQRTRELGIRMALGSSPAAVVGLVVRGGARLVGLGLAIGLAGGVLLGRVLASHIGGPGFDPVVCAAIPVLLGGAGIVSCILPAWRAVRIPPSTALRYE